MSWVATAIIGGAVIGGVATGSAARSAASAQTSAANRATDTQLQMFNQTRDDQAPWRRAGETALSAIGSNGEYFNHQFGPEDLAKGLAPNYDFMLKQGQGAVTAQANAMGGLGGNSLKAINDYTQNYAQNAYQQAYSNYTNNQTNIFNRLASIAGLGQTAGSNSTTGGSSYGASIGSAQMGAGNAAAGGAIGVGNAIGGAAGSIGNYYLLSSLLKSGNSAGTYGPQASGLNFGPE